MKTGNLMTVMLALLLSCSTMQAQFGGAVHRAARRGAEKAVTKKAEQKAEEETAKAIDRALNEKEKGDAALETALNRLDSTLQTVEIDTSAAAVADAPEVEIPSVQDTPYTPSESEFAFFAMQTGAVQLVATKDAKGKITSQTRNTVRRITGSTNAFAIDYESEILDRNGKPAGKNGPVVFNYRIVIKGGLMYLDLKGMFGAMDGLNSVQASGTAMKIPVDLQAGQSLEDASARVNIGLIRCSAVMTEGKCVAIEEVTVTAGTFKCYKVTQKINAVAMGIRNESVKISWYAKGVGEVKSETYDKKGKLQNSTELIKN